jgi:uncharacterized LabA/DUF88 family protein
MIAHKEQRVGIFIDIQNLYHSAKNLYNARVNYKELIRSLLAGRKLIRAIAYVVKSEGIVDTSPATNGTGPRERAEDRRERGLSTESAFFEALKQAGLELRTKDLQIYPGGMKKADWDVGMAVDSIRTAPGLDTIILVTGDGDFIPLVDYLRWGLGREVEVAAFSRTANGKLKEVADRFVAIEEVPKSLIKK